MLQITFPSTLTFFLVSLLLLLALPRFFSSVWLLLSQFHRIYFSRLLRVLLLQLLDLILLWPAQIFQICSLLYIPTLLLLILIFRCPTSALEHFALILEVHLICFQLVWLSFPVLSFCFCVKPSRYHFLLAPNISILISGFFAKSPSDVMSVFSQFCSYCTIFSRTFSFVWSSSVLKNSSQLCSVIKVNNADNTLYVKFYCL